MDGRARTIPVVADRNPDWIGGRPEIETTRSSHTRRAPGHSRRVAQRVAPGDQPIGHERRDVEIVVTPRARVAGRARVLVA